MDLKIKDVAQLLQVSEKTIYRWVSVGRIPGYKINHQYRFNRSEINEWILLNRINQPEAPLFAPSSPVNLPECLRRGGIFYKVSGTSVPEVLKNAIGLIQLPEPQQKQSIIAHILKREAMMPTAIGCGIAIPHPRVPILSDISSECVAICFLNEPVDFKALDKIPVHTLFVVLSANPCRHLEILLKISCLCRQTEFLELLRRQALREDILRYIEEQKKQWDS